MRKSRLFFGLLSLATLLVLTPARPLYAAPIQDDEVILGDDLTLNEGERVNGDLVIIGGDVTMRAGSRVEGSVTALGGRVEIDGTVEGELVALAGDIDLGPHANITGDIVALGGRVRQAEGAQTGKIVRGPAIRNVGFWQGLSFRSSSLRGESVAFSLAVTLVVAVILALVGMAIVTFWPTQTAQVAETVLYAPLPSLGVGCLLYPLAASLTVFVLITICLSPLAPVVVLSVVAASLFGWVALGTLGGRWLTRSTGWRTATPLAVTGVGVFFITFVTAFIGAIPCLGGLLTLSAASIGLGAATLSRFGTSSYRRRPVEPSAEA